MLRNLLATWETWSARNTLQGAVGNASTDQARDALTRSLADMPEVDPLDALRDTTELVALLQSWQWQIVYAARKNGASWPDIAVAMRLTVDRCQSDYDAAIQHQEACGNRRTEAYRMYA